MIDFSFANSPFAHTFDGVKTVANNLPQTAFNAIIGWIAIRITVWIVRKFFKLIRVPAALRGVIGSIVETFLWLLLIINLLQTLGFSGIIYFFSGSIAAIGLAMAAGGSTLISDIVAGIFLARDGDFNVGDEIKAGEEPAIQGIIERLDARRVRIRDSKGILHVLPNSVVERKAWTVLRRRSQVSADARSKAAKLSAKISKPVALKV